MILMNRTWVPDDPLEAYFLYIFFVFTKYFKFKVLRGLIFY